MKDFTVDTSNTTTSYMELSSSMVCIKDVPYNLSNETVIQRDIRGTEGRGAPEDEYRGIGNMVRSSGNI